MNYPSYTLLGIRVNPLTVSQFIDIIEESVRKHKRYIVGHHNLHSLYIYHHDQKMRDFYAKTTYTFIDGMALVLIGRLFKKPFERKQRMTSADWLWDLVGEANQREWKIFYLGSKPGTAEKGAEVLRQQYPGLQIATAHGYFDLALGSQASTAALNAINEYRPHILLVGMGMPRQEHWIFENAHHIQANTTVAVGACIDYVAGAISTPPRWMGKLGLEWFARLCSEPRRLWRRYLVEPWFILRILIYELVARE